MVALAIIMGNRYSYIPGISSIVLGYAALVTAMCVRRKPGAEPQVTLPMPLPPGQGGAEHKNVE